MARYLDARCRLCRVEGEKLFLKAERCFGDKCAIEKRSYPPGQHGQKGKKRPSDYGGQLREKQKLKRTFGIMESQMRLIYAEASRRRGATGKNLLQLLESRLDNVAYRMGMGASRSEARQLVRHNGLSVNGRRVNIPSYEVKPGDTLQLTEKAQKQLRIKASLEAAESRNFPQWLEVDIKAGRGVFKSRPEQEELQSNINDNLIVELYSR